MTPDDLIGHEAVLDRLTATLAEDRLAHALLLSGPAGVGKTTLALRLAAVALDAATWPGGLHAHPDLWCEDSDAERIGIDRIRWGAHGDDGPSLQDVMSLRPYAGGRRVAVIARAERLTEQAADSLLKTLEEPPPATLIVLCASSPDSLPPTVLSRLQQFALRPVPTAVIAAWLARSGVDEPLARLAAGLGAGRPGRARRLATEPGFLRGEVEALHAFLAVAGTGTDGALHAAAALTPPAGAEGRERALLLLAVWASFVRDAVFDATSVPEMRVWTEYAVPLERWAESLGPGRLTEILGLLLRATVDIAQNAQPRLTFDALFLDVFAGPHSPPPTAPSEAPTALGEAPVAEAANGRARVARPGSRRPRRR
jgi:DNA polymerase-3 subunit delta'